MAHAVWLGAEQPASYRNRWIPGPPEATHTPAQRSAATDSAAVNVIVFGGATLALGPGALAYELDVELASGGRVDLAGGGRGVGAHPQIDPVTGDLHLVSCGQEAAHHVVSPNFQTRTTRPILGAPERVLDLCLTYDRVVLLGDGVVGITARSGDARPRWVAADLAGAVNANDDGQALEVLATGTSLVRWRFDAGHGAQIDVLDDTPQQLGQINRRLIGARPRFLWSISAAGGTAIYRHDLRSGDRSTHALDPGSHPGAFTYVPDPARSDHEDGGWLVGLVHEERHDETELVLLDAAAIERGPTATVHIPRRLPTALRGTWAPAT